MATNAPVQRCMVCGEYLEWEVAPDNRPAGSPLVFGPTDWQQKPHSCPPGATEAWLERIGFGARKETTWCLDCGGRFTAEEAQGAFACPKCQSRGVPCSTEEDLTVEINWHELRVLGIWAENWARKDEKMLRTIAAITRRLERQHPGKDPLTLSAEISGLPAALAKEGMNVGPIEKQNIPDPPPIPINGPGAVGHSRVAPSMKATDSREG
jgi:hypothetical protein